MLLWYTIIVKAVACLMFCVNLVLIQAFSW